MARVDVAEGVVEGVDAQLGVLAVGGDVHLGVDLPGICEIGVVDLEDEAGVDDGLVFLAHGVGDGENVFLVRLVVLVDQPVLDRAGGDGGHEAFAAGVVLRAADRLSRSRVRYSWPT